MEATIRRYLEKECKKLIARHESLIRQSKHDQKRFKKRTGQAAGNPKSYRPQYWEAHPHFDLMDWPKASVPTHTKCRQPFVFQFRSPGEVCERSQFSPSLTHRSPIICIASCFAAMLTDLAR